MEENNNWQDISKNISEVSNKLMKKTDDEDLVDDLKESLKSTIENTSKLISNVLNLVESNIQLEEIKHETKEFVQKINAELAKLIRDNKSKFSDKINMETSEEE